MKNKIKRCTALFLSAVFCVTVMTSAVRISAVGEQANVYVNSYPYMGGENQHPADKNKRNWGHPALNFKNRWETAAKDHINLRAMNSFNGQICYCIEIGVEQHSGDGLTSHDENYWDNFPGNDVLDKDKIKLTIGRIFEYGYTGNISRYWVSQNASDADKLAHAYATQLLIWETIVGERDTEFNHVNTGSNDRILDLVNENHPLADRITAHYNSIVNSIKTHAAIPSFLSKDSNNIPNVKLEWDGSFYCAVLTDTNNVLEQFEFSSTDSNISFEKDGNELTIKTAVVPDESVTVTATRHGFRYGLITWSDGVVGQNGNIQDVVTYAASVPDPVFGYMNLTAEPAKGTVKIIKTSEDGNVAGISFRITGKGINRIVRSGADGTISVPGLTPGTYKVTEIIPAGYEPQPPQTVIVKSNETAEVRFHNTLKKGGLKIIKTSDDGYVSFIHFFVTGNGVNLDVTTNLYGEISVPDLKPGIYTVTEIVPEGYLPQEPKSVEVVADQITEISFHNIPLKGKLVIIKTSENGRVSGIKFRVSGPKGYDNIVITDIKGRAVLTDLVPGTYTITEIVPEGYIPQPPKTVEVKADI